ncbi:MAG: hypothetical protein OK457_04645 [Thaumarchaeota archaeon]|nr:hypothetical protein [Nitrososphaerota archaeon]
MTLKPRYVLPLNFRGEDKPLLDQIVLLAKKEDESITSVVRSALNEFAQRRRTALEQGGMHKIEEFCSPVAQFSVNEMLTPSDLKVWEDDEVLAAAKRVRSRKQELEAELKKRGYHNFSW